MKWVVATAETSIQNSVLSLHTKLHTPLQGPSFPSGCMSICVLWKNILSAWLHTCLCVFAVLEWAGWYLGRMDARLDLL